MPSGKKQDIYLVDAGMLPEIFIKVTEAKKLLETGEAATVAEAVRMTGISRSAFYKYKDGVSRFYDMKRAHIITFHILLRNRPGALSSLLAIFAGTGANILTINQSIPSNGVAAVTISAETANMSEGADDLLTRIRMMAEVVKAEVLAG